MELQRKDMDIKHWNAVLTWSIETWTSSRDMQLKRSLDMRHTVKCSMDMQHRMQPGYIARTCSMGKTSMDMQLGMQHEEMDMHHKMQHMQVE
jgi:hypothetical protein